MSHYVIQNILLYVFFFFSSRRRHTRSSTVSWARDVYKRQIRNISISYGINNYIDAKVFSKKDSVIKKISLIKGLSISGSYNVFDDSLNFTPVRAGFNPVSYTHLRAHETVLDLVCRLLLEKKKISNKLVLLSRARLRHQHYACQDLYY